jgi:hypothetical protein
MRVFVELEKDHLEHTSKVFVFGNPCNTVLAIKPHPASRAPIPDSTAAAVTGKAA